VKNNFDFLRISAALMVLFSHQFALLGRTEPAVLPGISFGEMGVCIFFSISGYLVSQSWMRDPYALRFMTRRLLRIWPGLFVATCFCALVIGPIATNLPLQAYLRAPEMHRFFGILRLKIQFNLPGVFLDTPFPRALNGSLWSIPLELSCYGVLLVAGILRLLNFRWIIVIMLAGLAFQYFRMDYAAVDQIASYKIRYGLFFGSGCCMWLFKDYRPRHRMIGMALLVTSIALGLCLNQYLLASLLAVPYISVVIGTSSTPVMCRFGRFGDLSYGVYIYAFPVQQTLIWATGGHLPFLAYLAASTLVTLLLAYASWHGVEAPALRMKPGAGSISS